MTLDRHPADERIRELIRTGGDATGPEIEQIIERMATAQFDSSVVPVRVEHRGVRYQGLTLGARSESLTYHLTKRVVIEEQWAPGTTTAQYVADLRRGMRDPFARLVVYERRGGHLAATVTPTDRVLPAERRGMKPERQLLVIYSVDRGIIVTGYQFSELAATGIPSEARWLK